MILMLVALSASACGQTNDPDRAVVLEYLKHYDTLSASIGHPHSTSLLYVFFDDVGSEDSNVECPAVGPSPRIEMGRAHWNSVPAGDREAWIFNLLDQCFAMETGLALVPTPTTHNGLNERG